MCSSKCPVQSYKPYLERVKFLVRLPDDKKLHNLVLIGTHSSLSYLINDEESQTQDLNIAQQLKYGIRVLDLGVRPKSNLFKISSESTPTDIDFSDALSNIDNFLDTNPGEFIIMFIRQVYPMDIDVTKSNCEILNHYISNSAGGKRLVKNWRLNDTIGHHRGKILLATWGEAFGECTFYLKRKCLIQNDDLTYRSKNRVYNLQDKWSRISKLLRNSYIKYSQCLINDISFSDGLNSRRAIAKDGGYFLNNSCAIPLNHAMSTNFLYSYLALNIIMADFVTQELIDEMNDSNFLTSDWRSGWH
ncbi:uncharacterized protein LOC130673334 [Microplitis mediator]|uniref:uncharacterized protein LOC130673334 n=1 Tax=Microplitis mediator TaxID=375433 RepID=UPI002552AF07|nr:uncharacterized protein LOC130673334 [Microplitis mediator]